MQKKRKSPRILVVTPEITYLPEGMGNMINSLHAKAGGLADVSASLVAALFRQGADVHVAGLHEPPAQQPHSSGRGPDFLLSGHCLQQLL